MDIFTIGSYTLTLHPVLAIALLTLMALAVVWGLFVAIFAMVMANSVRREHKRSYEDTFKRANRFKR